MKSYYPHWEYFKKVCRHKWHVGRACFRYGLYWRGIVHDLSKFSRAEFGPYAMYFHTPDGKSSYRTKTAFDHAWRHHVAHNPHHWEYWIAFNRGYPVAADMPEKYILEMVADWIGAGMTYDGQPDPNVWYYGKDAKSIIMMTQRTRDRVEELLREINPKGASLARPAINKHIM